MSTLYSVIIYVNPIFNYTSSYQLGTQCRRGDVYGGGGNVSADLARSGAGCQRVSTKFVLRNFGLFRISTRRQLP